MKNNTVPVISVAHYATDKETKKAILEGNKVRHKALELCHNRPDYKTLTLDEKNKIYDETVKQILLEG